MVTTILAPRLGGGRIFVIFFDAVVAPAEDDEEGVVEAGAENMRAKMRARSRRFNTMRSFSCIAAVVASFVTLPLLDPEDNCCFCNRVSY
jgi:hypothetical protein